MASAPLSLSEFVDRVYLPFHPGITPGATNSIRRTVAELELHLGVPLRVGWLSDDLLVRYLRIHAIAHAAETTNSRRRILLAVWRFAYRKGYHASLPRDIPKLPEVLRIPEAWTVPQIERLLVVCAAVPGSVGRWPAGQWWPALLLTLYWSGARIGTLLKVEPADFRPEQKCFIARHTKNRRQKLYPLHPQAVAAIQRIYDPAAPRLFDWPYCARHLWTRFRQYVESAGLPIGKGNMQLFHRVRRTNLSYCAVADIRLAQRQADHASEELTRQRYVDPLIAPERSAVDVLPVPAFQPMA